MVGDNQTLAHDDLMDSLSIIVEHTDLNPTSIISGSYRDE